MRGSRPGRPKKEDSKNIVLQIRIDEEMKNDIEEIAIEEGITVSDFVRKLIKNRIQTEKCFELL